MYRHPNRNPGWFQLETLKGKPRQKRNPWKGKQKGKIKGFLKFDWRENLWQRKKVWELGGVGVSKGQCVFEGWSLPHQLPQDSYKDLPLSNKFLSLQCRRVRTMTSQQILVSIDSYFFYGFASAFCFMWPSVWTRGQESFSDILSLL